MKKIVLFTALSISATIFAQTTPTTVKYRRSSLHSIMVDDAKLPNANVIKEAFTKQPLPDKYNDHSLTSRSFAPDKYALTAAEKTALGAKTEGKAAGKLKTMAKGAASSATGGLVDTTDAKYLPQVIEKYLIANNVAKDMVAKWFNRDASGAFNMNLIGERGSYDASALQVNTAKSSVRGMASIADAGVELIGNSFVVVTRFNFVSKKEIYDAAQAAIAAAAAVAGAGKLKGKIPGGGVANIPMTPEMQAAKDAAYKKATEGHIVQCTSYLYQLVWNDSVEAVFYNDLWMDASTADGAKRKKAFDESNLFSLKYIGDGKSFANVPLSLKKKRSDEELIAVATRNATDASIAKLQRDYEVFKTKTPLFSGNPITAKIGMKEGLEAGDKFEVLEQTMDEKTGKTKYVSKGKIKVTDAIWDNRFALDGEAPEAEEPALGKDGKPLPPKPVYTETTFKGGSKYYSGMLIRQIK
jgi:hypothetical protein